MSLLDRLIQMRDELTAALQAMREYQDVIMVQTKALGKIANGECVSARETARSALENTELLLK